MTASGAALLRQARTEAGLSRRGLATKAGVPTSTVSRIEDGRIDPTLAMLARLVDAAGGEVVITVRHRAGTPTLAELATAVDTESDRLKIDWTRLRGFVDWVGRHPAELAEAIADPPAHVDAARRHPRCPGRAARRRARPSSASVGASRRCAP